MMEQILNIILRRYIIRLIGRYSRYYYFKIIRHPKTMESLSNTLKDDDTNFESAINQDISNVLVGYIVILLSICIVWLIW